MKRIRIINGVNLNMLGKRDKKSYGIFTLEELYDRIKDFCGANDILPDFFQSNYEGEIVEEIQKSIGKYDGIIINPGAFTHYSYAIRDALEMIDCPIIEVHISNVDAREEFRKTSVTAPVCTGSVRGLGWQGYIVALNYFII